jgi:protein-L-isoaspartate(D-aspartate) O-methyltransferase
MLKVAREDYVPAARREAAYLGENISLGEGRVVLEPRTLAKMLDELGIENDELVLDIGCGYGYSSAVIAHMAEAVVAVESDEQMAKEAQETLINADIDNVIVHPGALAEGAQQHGPYDVMIVQGGVAEVPEALLAQLKNGGRIACLFMDGPLGEVRLGYKSDHGISWRKSFNAAAPLLNGFTRAKEFQL